MNELAKSGVHAFIQGGNTIELNLMANVVRETVDHVGPRPRYCLFLTAVTVPTVTAYRQTDTS